MRVRPFFWGFFVVVYLSILAWAAFVPRRAPVELTIHVISASTLEVATSFLVDVTDTNGETFDHARLVSQAWMPTMHMSDPLIVTTREGQGVYLVQICFSMTGQWMIAVSLQANGFALLRQTLPVQISPQPVPAPTPTGIARILTGSAGNPCATAMAARTST